MSTRLAVASWLDCRVTPREGIHAWRWRVGHKSLARGVTGPMEEAANDGLLDVHVVKLPSKCLYLQSSAVLGLGHRSIFDLSPVFSLWMHVLGHKDDVQTPITTFGWSKGVGSVTKMTPVVELTALHLVSKLHPDSTQLLACPVTTGRKLTFAKLASLFSAKWQQNLHAYCLLRNKPQNIVHSS